VAYNEYFKGNTMHKCKSTLILTLIILTACEADIQSNDTDAMAAKLLQADTDFAALSQNTDPKQAFANYLAPNAIMIPRAGDPIEGYDAAMASFGEEAAFELYWQPQFAEVAESGDMGWTWGRYQLLVEGEQLYSGKYVNIWTRQPDGSWQVRLDMGNQEPE
jgi:ketosteroid isomerase-like protein